MTYIVLPIILVLVLLNARASFLVTRSAFNGRFQKFMQLALIWLIPFICAMVTAQVHKGIGSERSSGQPWNSAGFEEGADWALHHDNGMNDPMPPGEAS